MLCNCNYLNMNSHTEIWSVIKTVERQVFFNKYFSNDSLHMRICAPKMSDTLPSTVQDFIFDFIRAHSTSDHSLIAPHATPLCLVLPSPRRQRGVYISPPWCWLERRTGTSPRCGRAGLRTCPSDSSTPPGRTGGASRRSGWQASPTWWDKVKERSQTTQSEGFIKWQVTFRYYSSKFKKVAGGTQFVLVAEFLIFIVLVLLSRCDMSYPPLHF